LSVDANKASLDLYGIKLALLYTNKLKATTNNTAINCSDGYKRTNKQTKPTIMLSIAFMTKIKHG
jgi:hypothetical protein